MSWFTDLRNSVENYVTGQQPATQNPVPATTNPVVITTPAGSMSSKTLIYVAIGAVVLLVAFLAFKK